MRKGNCSGCKKKIPEKYETGPHRGAGEAQKDAAKSKKGRYEMLLGIGVAMFSIVIFMAIFNIWHEGVANFLIIGSYVSCGLAFIGRLLRL